MKGTNPSALSQVWLCTWCGCATHFAKSFLLLIFFPKAAKDNGDIELGNKKLEKESKNEQEREKKENMAKETRTNFTSQLTVKGLSNLGNTCFFNAVMQVPAYFSCCANPVPIVVTHRIKFSPK